MMKILFLGDSITDADHCFDPDNLGTGYVKMLHDLLCPGFSELSVSNKGIDGFTVSRVYTMWQNVPAKSSFDIVSILVGVNDVGVWMDCGHSEQWLKDATLEFARTYEDMIMDILDHGIKHVILMEPFIFPYPEEFRLWQPWMKEISFQIQSIARRYHLAFLPLQEALTEASLKEGYPAITPDGIHLTEKGNQLLTSVWMNTFEQIV